jgi:hypothetical protein
MADVVLQEGGGGGALQLGPQQVEVRVVQEYGGTNS